MAKPIEYEDVLNILPDAICIIDSRTNTVKYVNETFSKQLVSHTMIVGHSFESKILQEDNIELFLSCIKEALTTSRDVEIGCCNSLSCIGKDKFPLYKNYFWIVRKINDDSVMVRGNIYIEKNETLHSQEEASEDTLPPEKADDYTTDLLDFLAIAPISMHWLSPTGQILWANNAELDSLGYSKEEYIGHHIKEFCPDDEAALNKCFLELSAGRAIREEPFKFLTKSGEIKHLLVDSNVSRNSEGIFIFMRDDTERRVEEQISDLKLKTMKSLNDMKDSFIRRIFHDIKTPLHVISNSLTEIEESIENNTVTKRDDVACIEQNIDSILSTAEDVNYSLEFNEGRTISINRLPFDIESSIRDIATYVETIERNSSQSVMFDYHFDKSLSTKSHVLADSAIYRVLFHLIRNAVRFSPRLANIKIEVKYMEDSLQHQFKVTNNTENPVDLKAINNSFHNSYSCMKSDNQNDSMRVSDSLTDVRGLGLGLYVSYNLIQAMGGMLECSNIDGSDLVTFQFHLKLPATGKGSPPPNLRKASISALLKRESFRIWTNMCDAEAARTHVIEDSEFEWQDPVMQDSMVNIISKSSKSNKASTTEGTVEVKLSSKSILKPPEAPAIVSSSSKSLIGISSKGVSTINLSAVNLSSQYAIDISTKGVSTQSPQQTLSFVADTTGGTGSSDTPNSHQPQPPVAMYQSSKSKRPSLNRTIIDPTTQETEEKQKNKQAALGKQVSRLYQLQQSNGSSSPIMYNKFPAVAVNRQNSVHSNYTDESGKSTSSITRRSIPRILVVDDSPMCQRVLIRILTSDGYDVDTANNGLEAVEKLSIEPCIYKACLMDLRMPIMDGITATKICRQKSHLKALRIIVITAEQGEHILSQVKEAGANYMIPKPAVAGVIKQAIEMS